MRGITRYIVHQLLVGVIFVALGLASLVWLSQSLRFLELIMSKGLSITAFLRMTSLLLPRFFTLILPIAMFSVVLFVYNRMNTDRELVILRASGMSNWELARPAVGVGLLLSVFALLMTLHIVPESLRTFRQIRWKVRHDVSHLLLQEGEFNHIGQDVTVFVRNTEPDGSLNGIMVHDTHIPGRKVTMMAERGQLVQNEDAPHVIMINGSRQVIRGENQFSILYFDSYTLDFGAFHEDTGPRFRDAQERSMGDLLNMTADDSPHLNKLDIHRFRVEAHKRLLQPFYNLMFVLVGLACLLGGNFSRHGQTRRILMTIAVMVFLQVASLGLENSVSKNLWLLPGMYVLLILPALMAFLYLRREKIPPPLSSAIARPGA